MTFQADAFQDNFQHEAGIFLFPPAYFFNVKRSQSEFVVKPEIRMFRVEPIPQETDADGV